MLGYLGKNATKPFGRREKGGEFQEIINLIDGNFGVWFSWAWFKYFIDLHSESRLGNPCSVIRMNVRGRFWFHPSGETPRGETDWMCFFPHFLPTFTQSIPVFL